MKILIVKIGAIGDVVMATTMLSFLKATYPASEITWLCGVRVSSLIRATNLVDQVIEVEEEKLFKGSFVSKCFALFGVWNKLFGLEFDLVLTAHPDWRYALLTKFLRAKERRLWERKVEGMYHALQYLRLAKGTEDITSERVIFPEIKDLPRWELEEPYLVVAPGGAKNILADDEHRRWPIEYYAEVMKTIECKIVIVGADSDAWVRSFLPKDRYLDLIGKTDLLDMVAILNNARLLLTHDSGPLHLGKLVKCPTIALFGPTNPAELVREDQIKVLWGGEHLSCRPCYNGKKFAPCSNFLCMKSTKPQEVIEHVLSHFSTSSLS